MIGYLLPIMLFVGTCFHLSNQGNIHAAVKLAAVIGVFFTLCGLLQLMFGKAPEGASLMEYYTVSSVNGAGGGLVGGALSGLLSFLLGRAGAYLVLVVLLIICMVCITGKSFVSLYSREVTGPISMQGRIWTAGENSMLREQKKDVFLRRSSVSAV